MSMSGKPSNKPTYLGLLEPDVAFLEVVGHLNVLCSHISTSAS